MSRVCINDHRAEQSLGDPRWMNGCAQCELERLQRYLREIFEEYAGAEYGEPVYAQEAYVIALVKRMASLAQEAIGVNPCTPSP